MADSLAVNTCHAPVLRMPKYTVLWSPRALHWQQEMSEAKRGRGGKRRGGEGKGGEGKRRKGRECKAKLCQEAEDRALGGCAPLSRDRWPQPPSLKRTLFSASGLSFLDFLFLGLIYPTGNKYLFI